MENTVVQPVGSSTVVVPQGVTQVIYRLVAERENQETLLSQTISVQQACEFTWFFNAPSGTPCPAGAAVSAPGAYQPFQSGFMFRVQYNGMDRVCGIQNNRNVYSCAAFLSYTGTPPVTPPDGLQAPSADFQDVFYNRLAIGGFWYDVIGWATAPVNNNPLTVQPSDDAGLYIQLPNGLYRFDGSLTSGALNPIQPATP